MVEEVRNVEDLIKTEKTSLEDKAKNVPTVGFNRLPTLQYIIP